MDHPDPTFNDATGTLSRSVKYLLQPLALIVIIWFWMSDTSSTLAFAICLGTLHVVLGGLERVIPARPGWLIPAREQARNVLLVIALTIAIGYVAALYDEVLREPLALFRQSLDLDI
jgi:hypothetical protein